MVLEESEDGDDARGGDVDCEFILPDGESNWRSVNGQKGVCIEMDMFEEGV